MFKCTLSLLTYVLGMCAHTKACVCAHILKLSMFMHVCKEVYVYFRKQCGGVCVCMPADITCAVHVLHTDLLRGDFQGLVGVLSRDS